MHCKYFSGIGILMSLLLMALPCGVTMRMADGPGQWVVAQYSYLSGMPMGYGNWFPILAVAFTALALVFLLLRRDYGEMAPICLGLSAASQILSWIIFSSFTLTGLAIIAIQISVLLQKHLPRWQPGWSF